MNSEEAYFELAALLERVENATSSKWVAAIRPEFESIVGRLVQRAKDAEATLAETMSDHRKKIESKDAWVKWKKAEAEEIVGKSIAILKRCDDALYVSGNGYRFSPLMFAVKEQLNAANESAAVDGRVS